MIRGSRYLLVIALLTAPACKREFPRDYPRKVIVLGFDGMDPGFLERHWDALPNLDRLRKQGAGSSLRTTTPPQSPVAWSSFITGLDPSGHGIYDFVHRDPATMRPVSAMGATAESGIRLPLGPYELPLTAGHVSAFRKGTAFWQLLAAHHVPATVLRMPTNYPPVSCQCLQLAGMGTPDLLGTFGTFTLFTDDPAETTRAVSGGKIIRVAVTAGKAALQLEGPANSLRRDRRPTYASIAAYVDGEAARFDLDGRRIVLRQGEWSEWLRVEFPLIPFIKHVTGIVRIFVKELSPRFRVYISPVNIDPTLPDAPLTVPPGYSRDLARAVGPFHTQGIAEDTAALRQGVFDLPQYLAQSRTVAREQVAILRYGLDQFRGGFLFMHFLGIDQDSHMLWGRHDDELLATYRMFDSIVGDVMARAPGAALIVMSDHGFAPFDRAFHLNTWLMREGFLTLDNPANVGAGELFEHVDWSRTQAYALGLNGLYLNIRGRERNGIVDPGTQAELLVRVISRRLLEYKDPQSGKRTVTRLDLAAGPMAPDLIVGYNLGYRGSWQSALGALPMETIEDNRDAWIGDHCIAAQHVPGVIIANRPIRLADPGLTDVTAAILADFGVERPSSMKGRPIF